MTFQRNPLLKLKIKDLARILKHVRLGREHLVQHLKPVEFQELLAVGSLRDHERENVRSDLQEKTGNIILVLNTILTSSMGAWLGFAGFGGFHLQNIFTIFIVLTAITIGALIGRLSYRLTTRQAQDSIVSHKLFNIEFEMINAIVDKRTYIIEKIEKTILNYMSLLGDQAPFSLDNNAPFLKELLQNKTNDTLIKQNMVYLIEAVDSQVLKTFYENMVQHLLEEVEKLTSRLRHTYYPEKISEDVVLEGGFSEVDLLLNTALTNASYIRVLTKPDLAAKRMIPKATHWLTKNFLGIAVGLLPTIMGGFASMFVFLDGIPDILRAFHLYQPAFEHYNFQIKIFSFMCALCITTYMGYSNIHTNYKAFRRTKQLELAEKKIAEAEEKMMQQENILHMLIKLKNVLNQLRIICQSIKLMQAEKATTETLECST